MATKKFYEYNGVVFFAPIFEILAEARRLHEEDSSEAAAAYLQAARPYERLNKLNITVESDLAFATSDTFTKFQ